MKGSKALESRTSADPYARQAAPADLAGTLHEVSNALTVVLGWLDAARTHIGDGAARHALDVARCHADMGYRIARSAIGAEVIDAVDRTALGIANDALLGAEQEARRAGVRLVLDDGGTADSCVRDGVVALQILLNLLLNAISFSPKGGTVTLEVAYAPAAAVRTSRRRSGEGPLRLASDCFKFRVRDEGPGVPLERAGSILQGPPSTRRGGAGIGLTYSASLAAERGGSLQLAHPGPGAVFELTWPAQEARSAIRNRIEPVALDGVRVLVVEDDQNVLSLIEFALEAHGVQVLSAGTTEDVAEILANGQTFDAALIDLSPFDGAEVELTRLRGAVSGPSIILISGMMRDVPPALEGRIASWVRKPFEMGEVVEVLHRIVKR